MYIRVIPLHSEAPLCRKSGKEREREFRGESRGRGKRVGGVAAIVLLDLVPPSAALEPSVVELFAAVAGL